MASLSNVTILLFFEIKVFLNTLYICDSCSIIRWWDSISMSVPYPDNLGHFMLKLVENQVKKTLNNADEVMDAIKSARREIKERIEYLESQVSDDSIEAEREIAVLIRQDQYFENLEGKQKSELEAIFFAGRRLNDNCIYPDVLQWYQPPSDEG